MLAGTADWDKEKLSVTGRQCCPQSALARPMTRQTSPADQVREVVTRLIEVGRRRKGEASVRRSSPEAPAGSA